MDALERNELIELYGRGYDDLVACLEELPKEIWKFKPEPKEWSVHEILIHLADSETNSALRARLLISEPGKTSMGYDQDLWVETTNYHDQSWKDALEGLKWARKTTLTLINNLDEGVWQHAVIHPEVSEPYTFEMWLKIYSGHVAGHIEQIKNNYRIWKEKEEA
ncbi:MAG: DinB family protein [Chloroflexi bacterium]|jgi:hypothetical protein|nr:DinB family protein [Chloroflexota bacterium]MBT3669756.1 DinB family protein [Chloroflexota bacterium]MBT4003395.1 DinB family protein [Chloroflexota bacterium]MBT4305236.1 DinB family protein [Chloroflexota bacterium]MBT4534841.1 DinB family protein [Chloroflexota bacterium]